MAGQRDLPVTGGRSVRLSEGGTGGGEQLEISAIIARMRPFRSAPSASSSI